MASALKLDIPVPVTKDSQGFAEALKACIAASAYGVEVQYAKAPGQNHVSLELPKERKQLFEINAIVRYFSSIGKSKFASDLHDDALIEWEETILEPSVRDPGAVEKTLGLAEKAIASSSFAKPRSDSSNPPSPAEIIIFATLYSPLSTIPTPILNSHPTLKSWFFTLALTSPWALGGIEQAASQTSELSNAPIHGDKQPQAASADSPIRKKTKDKVEGLSKEQNIVVPETKGEVKLREGVQMAIPDPSVKILPQPGRRNILITSALPYVNNVPHLGNIVGSVLSADVFSRYNKARNNNTVYICGTDEYGTATETKALEDGVTPLELCNKYHLLHKETYEWFEIGFDHFGRTTTQQQTEIAQDIFLKLDKHGYLDEKSSNQPFCEKHQGFLADRFVEGECPKCGYNDARGDQCDKCGSLLDPFDLINPRCKLDGTTPILRETKHVHLLLDKLQPAIEEWAQKSYRDGSWSKNGWAIYEGYFSKEGLKSRPITRDLKWGTPVPREGYDKKVLYVWFDACIGYVSITANYTKEWEKWWRDPENVKLYQFMGKDNVPFHTIIFPGSQIGTGDKWTMLNHLSTTEYLNYEGGKFSKSRNIGVFGNSAKLTGVPPSVWRYYLLSSRPETSDTQFEWRQFIQKNNSELLANLGNFVNRVVKFVGAKYGRLVPDYYAQFADPSFDAFKAEINALLATYVSDLDAVHIRAGLERVMAISARGNQFLQDNKLDNNLFANRPETAAAVVGLGLNLIYLLSALVYPYMPSTAEGIVEQLNAPLRAIPDVWTADDILPGHMIGKAKYLFSRIDEAKEDEWRNAYGGEQLQKMKKEEGEAKKAKKEAMKKKGGGAAAEKKA